MDLRRRTFLGGMAAAAGGLVVPDTCFGAGLTAGERPNILVCVADDWSYDIASLYAAVQVPNLNRLARAGASFTRAFCISSTCAPARAGILTGQPPHRLEQAANLWGTLPAKFPVYPDLLESAGYVVGFTGKGYAPAIDGDRTRNAAGPFFSSFDAFMATVPADSPFCYWFGSLDAHRPYDPNLARAYGMQPDNVRVPDYLPNAPAVRGDILDYCAAAQQFDADLGRILARLQASGRAANTLVVVTADNGMPFPRAKATAYDAGTRVPLIVRFPGVVSPGLKLYPLVSLLDLAPTFLQLAGVAIPSAVAGKSLLYLLTGGSNSGRVRIFIERERHGRTRENNVGFPIRAIRTKQHLWIRNCAPDRWPAGDPTGFGDIDGGPSKALIVQHRDDPAIAPYFHLACDKRPAVELYDVIADPWQMTNLANRPGYASLCYQLDSQLTEWMIATADPRAVGQGDEFDRYPYYGKPASPT